MMDMDEIMEKILADRELYGNGGVILSGGDPLMQPEAATAVLKKCKEHGIRTAIETTAFAKPLAFSRFIANADMIIIDLKHYSEKKYVQFTGVSNHSILENLDFARYPLPSGDNSILVITSPNVEAQASNKPNPIFCSLLYCKYLCIT